MEDRSDSRNAKAEIILRDQGILLIVQAPVLRPPSPQRFRIGEFMQCKLPLENTAPWLTGGDLVVELKFPALCVIPVDPGGQRGTIGWFDWQT